jgi:hypothetical protein
MLMIEAIDKKVIMDVMDQINAIDWTLTKTKPNSRENIQMTFQIFEKKGCKQKMNKTW